MINNKFKTIVFNNNNSKWYSIISDNNKYYQNNKKNNSLGKYLELVYHKDSISEFIKSSNEKFECIFILNKKNRIDKKVNILNLIKNNTILKKYNIIFVNALMNIDLKIKRKDNYLQIKDIIYNYEFDVNILYYTERNITTMNLVI